MKYLIYLMFYFIKQSNINHKYIVILYIVCCKINLIVFVILLRTEITNMVQLKSKNPTLYLIMYYKYIVSKTLKNPLPSLRQFHGET